VRKLKGEDFTMDENSAFSKIMKLIDEKIIFDHVQKKGSDRWTKKFSTRDHLASMIFAQLAGSKSLRQLEVQFSSFSQKTYTPVKRSTLSDANKNRNYKVFELICRSLMKNKSREINELMRIFDSTPIVVRGEGSVWTKKKASPRLRGFKVHISYAPECKVFNELEITHANVNDVSVGRKWKVERGVTYVFDKGYMDYNWWHKIHGKGAYFVTRIKKNTAYIVLEEKEINEGSSGVISEQMIRLKNRHPRGGKINFLADTHLRLATVHDSIYDKTYSFVCNNLAISAQEIATYYKKRWDIELLFKWIKQNLKIKQLFSNNQNAIKTQIYTALISYLLLLSLKKKCTGFSRVVDFLTWVRTFIFSPMPSLILNKDYDYGSPL